MSIPSVCPPRAVVADLARERAAASVDARDLTHVVSGGEESTRLDDFLQGLLAADPLFDKTQVVFMDRTAVVARARQVASRLQSLIETHGLSYKEGLRLKTLSGEVTSQTVSDFMFVPLMEGQAGSDPKKQQILEDAKAGRLIGCYAQTELAHGSNVRRLETTATYVGAAGGEAMLELSTPATSSTKWWVGALGCHATHAIVFAQLVVKGRRAGVYPFLMRIREDTLKPVAGVVCGDIGPKLGFNSMDNGFLQFASGKVRIPGSALLSAATLSADGTFTPPPPSQAVAGYFGMTAARALIVAGGADALGRAVTIAVRYSAVRRQFEPAGARDGLEVQVLDHYSQQRRLLRLVATVYALTFMGRTMASTLDTVKSALGRGDGSGLGALHSLTSGLKAWVSTIVWEGIETCRQCCGGHGYSQFSGLPQLQTTYAHLLTADGENWVMTQVLGRALLKAASGDAKHAAGHAAYLANPPPAIGPLDDPEAQHAALQRVVFAIVQTVGTSLTAGGLSWNDVLMDVRTLAFAHCAVTMHRSFLDAAHATPAGPIRALLLKFVALFALSWVEDNMAWLLESGAAPTELPATARDLLRATCAALRPDAVASVDALNFHDGVLGSALGRYDGDYVPAMFAWAQLEPLTASPPRAKL